MDRYQLQNLYEAYVNIYENKEEIESETFDIRDQLYSIVETCQTLINCLDSGDYNIDEWIQEKVTEAEGMLHEASEYIGYLDEKIATGTGKEEMPSAAARSRLAKRARRGEDIGHEGKGFKALAAKAAKRYGSKEAGERVAAAAMFKQQAK